MTFVDIPEDVSKVMGKPRNLTLPKAIKRRGVNRMDASKFDPASTTYNEAVASGHLSFGKAPSTCQSFLKKRTV